MILSHENKSPVVDPSSYVAPNATVCGDVKVGQGSRIMFGACVIAEGKPITIGTDCIVMENAVLRSTDKHSLSIGNHCLIGPHAHVVACTIADDVFIATGASVFHGADLGPKSEVRVNGVVHLRTELPADAVVPIGWVAVGRPAVILPPEKHDEIWAIQKRLDFPGFVYDVTREDNEQGMPRMTEITRRRSEALGRHSHDRVVSW
jgi:carbonic anhydrase/acetyltransferase-like protein (isoleucine patch superfamily)